MKTKMVGYGGWIWKFISVLLFLATFASARMHSALRRSPERLRSHKKSTEQHIHVSASKLTNIRGGASRFFSFDNIMNRTAKTFDLTGTTDVLVTTALGSTFLDKKKKLTVNRNDTVVELKLQLFTKFPGSPPAPLQKLYYSNRLLNDSELIGNISSLSPLPVVLDMISGTSVYNRSMSIAQSLEAYVATVVQQAYIGTKLQQTHKPQEDGSAEAAMDTPYFRELFHSINASLYEKYGEDIELAKEAEREPEAGSADTAPWRSGGGTANVRPLAAAIAKEFDLNWRGLRSFVYYSVILVVFAYFGSPTPSSTRTMLAMIPVLWLSKLRQLRLLFKIALYLALPVIYELDFLMPLLPAPLQVIAQQSTTWEADARVLPRTGGSWLRTLKRRIFGPSKKQGLKKRGFSAARKMLKSRKTAPNEETSDVSGSQIFNETTEPGEDEVIDLDEVVVLEEQVEIISGDDISNRDATEAEEEAAAGSADEDEDEDEDSDVDVAADDEFHSDGDDSEDLEGPDEDLDLEELDEDLANLEDEE